MAGNQLLFDMNLPRLFAITVLVEKKALEKNFMKENSL